MADCVAYNKKAVGKKLRNICAAESTMETTGQQENEFCRKV